MKIVRIGPNEFWTVPEGVNVMDHVEPGVKIMWLEKLPHDSIEIGNLSNGMKQYRVDWKTRNAVYQKTFDHKMKDTGHKRVCVWILAIGDNEKELKEFAEKLR